MTLTAEEFLDQVGLEVFKKCASGNSPENVYYLSQGDLDSCAYFGKEEMLEVLREWMTDALENEYEINGEMVDTFNEIICMPDEEFEDCMLVSDDEIGLRTHHYYDYIWQDIYGKYTKDILKTIQDPDLDEIGVRLLLNLNL